MKKQHSKYQINIQSLDNKRHEYEFEGDSEFFESFEQDIVEKGNFEAKVTLEKSLTMMRLDINIKGNVSLICDRSLREFEEALDIQESYVYKFGDNFEVVSEDMEIVPFGVAEIDLAKNFFEYICLAIPMKRLHPDLRDRNDEGSFIFSDIVEEKIEKGQEVDPRWAALEKLKKKL